MLPETRKNSNTEDGCTEESESWRQAKRRTRQLSLVELLTADAPGETVPRKTAEGKILEEKAAEEKVEEDEVQEKQVEGAEVAGQAVGKSDVRDKEGGEVEDERRSEVYEDPRMIPLKSLPTSRRPRERLLEHGAGSLTDEELLAVLLRTGRPGQSAVAMAGELLREHGGVGGLLWSDLRRMRRHGLGPAKAATVLASLELGRRLAKATLKNENLMDRPESVARYLYVRYGRMDQEVMGALFVDMRNHLVGEHETFRGTLTRAAVEPRAIIREGLLSGAAGMLLFHTHPSGDPGPSPEDLSFTRRMAEAGELMGIRLVDHVIVGDQGTWVSLKQRGAW